MSEPVWSRGLNRQQRLAVESDAPALLVRAGPGTGKTRVLACRIARFISFPDTSISPSPDRSSDRPVKPESILAITFTNQAAEEMAKRLAAMEEQGAEGASRVQTSTFHSWAWRVLSALEGAGSFSVISEAEQTALVKAAMEELGIEGDARGLGAAVSLEKQKARPCLHDMPEDVRAVWGLYHRKLEEFGLKDYDDLILQLLDLLKALPSGLVEPDLFQPERSRTWRRLSAMLPRFLFVDEFQDVSPAQFELVRALYGRCQAVTVIGDENQAIYGFRGASSASMDRFLEEFPGARQVNLSTAYRCPQVILDAAQAVVGPGRQEEAGLKSARKAEAVVARRSFKSDREEAAWITAAIEKAVGALSFDAIDSGLSDGTAYRSLSDVAVLYRFNRMAHPISKALSEAGIPYQVCRRKSPLEDTELACLNHLLALIQVRRPTGGPGSAADLEASGRAGQGLEEFHLLQLARRAKKRPDDSLIRKLEQIYLSAPPEAFVEAAFKGLGFDAPEKSLMEQAVRAAEMAGKGMPPALLLKSEPDALDIETEAVTLMTIHAAKGREFPVVFVIGLEGGVLPWDKGDPQEERRLFYVAMTRASEQLVITRCGRRVGFSEQRLKPSPFLDQIKGFIPEAAPERPRKKRRRKRQKSLF